MNAIVKANPQLPAAIRNMLATQGEHVMQEITGGVTSGFPVMSYRGKVWRVRKGGHEEDVLDENGDAIPSVEVVLIKSNPLPSKIYYNSKYAEGATDAPTCWSANGVTPDAGVQNPIAKQCAACKFNQWGSKITEQGAKTKMCADARRMAVVSKQELEEKGADAPVYLLRVPAASLNPLKDYAEKVLKPKGLPYFAVVSRIGFDSAAAYPKLTFRASRYLSDDEAQAVVTLRESEDVKRILAEAAEFDAAGTTEGGDASASGAEEVPTTPAASAARKAKPRPAEVEDIGLDDEPAPPPKPAPAPAAKKAAPKPAPAPVVEEDDEEEDIAPPPAPAPKKAAAKPAPAPVVVDDDEEEIAAPAPAPAAKKKAAAPKKAAPAPAEEATVADGNEDFGAMLDSILGG